MGDFRDIQHGVNDPVDGVDVKRRFNDNATRTRSVRGRCPLQRHSRVGRGVSAGSAEAAADGSAQSADRSSSRSVGRIDSACKSRGRTATRERGEDIEHPFEITLEEAARGGERTIQMELPETCPTCGGSGFTGERRTVRGRTVMESVTCPTCSGAGVRATRRQIQVLVPNLEQGLGLVGIKLSDLTILLNRALKVLLGQVIEAHRLMCVAARRI